MVFFSLDGYTPVTRRGRQTIISPENDDQRINLENVFAANNPDYQSDSNDDQSIHDCSQSVTSDDDSESSLGSTRMINRNELSKKIMTDTSSLITMFI